MNAKDMHRQTYLLILSFIHRALIAGITEIYHL